MANMTRSIGALRRLTKQAAAASPTPTTTPTVISSAHAPLTSSLAASRFDALRSIPTSAVDGRDATRRDYHALPAAAATRSGAGSSEQLRHLGGHGRGDPTLRCSERTVNGPLRLFGAAPASTSINSINTATTTNSAALTNASSDRLLVVGSGVAGCAAALIAAQTHRLPVTLLYAGTSPTDCNSYWAQGGIIYRNYDPASGDSAQSLADDIHRAGAGLCVDEAVWKVATEGPDRVKELLLDERKGGKRVFANVPFDREDDGRLSHCLEASHAAARILHRADSTGKAITEHITRAAVNHPLVSVVSDSVVTDLVVVDGEGGRGKVCVGAQVLDRTTRKVSTMLASHGTLLASGGLAGIYEHSTNPSGFNALGSSAALATRAGAATRDLEYVQFHPTSLYLPNEARFLLTEALRGEGAVLRDANGRAFAKDFHEDGELAPRDVVARGVYAEAQKTAHLEGTSNAVHNAYLDITHRDADWLRGRFPTIQAHLMQRNLDITRDQLPVIPAAHYTCGGIETDLDGRTTLTGLYSAGEAARTGLHGGNRLASTSLLEGLVYGAAVADFVGSDTNEAGQATYDEIRAALSAPSAPDQIRHQSSRTAGRNVLVNGEAAAKVDAATSLLAEIKSTMWNGVGVVRTPSGIAAALDRLVDMKHEADELYDSCPAFETAAVRDAACAGEAVAAAALRNRESRGAHTILLDEDEEDSDDEEVACQAAGV